MDVNKVVNDKVAVRLNAMAQGADVAGRKTGRAGRAGGRRRFVPGRLTLLDVADALERTRRWLGEATEAEVGLEAFLPVVAANAPDRERRCRVAVASTFLEESNSPATGCSR